MFPTFLEATQRGKTRRQRHESSLSIPDWHRTELSTCYFPRRREQNKQASKQASNSVPVWVFFFRLPVPRDHHLQKFPIPPLPPLVSSPLRSQARWGSNGPSSPMGIRARWMYRHIPLYEPISIYAGIGFGSRASARVPPRVSLLPGQKVKRRKIEQFGTNSLPKRKK